MGSLLVCSYIDQPQSYIDLVSRFLWINLLCFFSISRWTKLELQINCWEAKQKNLFHSFGRLYCYSAMQQFSLWVFWRNFQQIVSVDPRALSTSCSMVLRAGEEVIWARSSAKLNLKTVVIQSQRTVYVFSLRSQNCFGWGATSKENPLGRNCPKWVKPVTNTLISGEWIHKVNYLLLMGHLKRQEGSVDGQKYHEIPCQYNTVTNV